MPGELFCYVCLYVLAITFWWMTHSEVWGRTLYSTGLARRLQESYLEKRGLKSRLDMAAKRILSAKRHQTAHMNYEWVVVNTGLLPYQKLHV